jgi:hypothetical protein
MSGAYLHCPRCLHDVHVDDLTFTLLQKMDANMIIARDIMALINKEAYQDVWRQSGIRIFATTGETHET